MIVIIKHHPRSNWMKNEEWKNEEELEWINMRSILSEKR